MKWKERFSKEKCTVMKTGIGIATNKNVVCEKELIGNSLLPYCWTSSFWSWQESRPEFRSRSNKVRGAIWKKLQLSCSHCQAVVSDDVYPHFPFLRSTRTFWLWFCESNIIIVSWNSYYFCLFLFDHQATHSTAKQKKTMWKEAEKKNKNKGKKASQATSNHINL